MKVKCCGCKERFDKETSIRLNAGWFHSINCATEYSTKKSRRQREQQLKRQEKQEKKAHAKRKRELKDNDKSYQTKKTQEIFNKYIRLRDSNDFCISCGRSHSGQYHAGHYRSVGSCPELRFDQRNCHKQCAPCNDHLSGNLVAYRVRLISKIGLDRVNFLEGPHEPRRYTIRQLKIIQKWFTRKTKRLREKEDV